MILVIPYAADAIDAMTKQIEYDREEYMLECLEDMGYSQEYVRAHRTDFAPMQFNCANGHIIICMWYLPTMCDICWFEEAAVEVKHGNGYRIEFTLSLVPPDRVDDLRHEAAEVLHTFPPVEYKMYPLE